MNNLNIAIIALGVYPYQTGGVELHSYKQVQKLTDRGHEVTCYTRRRSNDGRDRNNQHNRIQRIGPGYPVLGPLWFVIVVSWKLLGKRKQIDLVHVQYATYFIIPAWILHVLKGTPFVVSCRGSDLILWSRNPILSRFQRFLLKGASVITTVSTEMKEILLRDYHFPSEKIVVLPNVVDDDDISVVLNKPKQQRSNQVVVFLGNLKPVKDPMTTISAFRLLHDRLRHVKLVLVGEGPLHSEISRFVRNAGIQDSVALKRSMDHLDALNELRNSDVLVSSSVSEGSPNAVIEAMALGVPVIGTDVGGTRDVITDGKTGLIVATESPADLADAMYSVLTDVELARKLVAGAMQEVAQLNWRNLITEYEDMYGRALKKNAAVN